LNLTQRGHEALRDLAQMGCNFGQTTIGLFLDLLSIGSVLFGQIGLGGRDLDLQIRLLLRERADLLDNESLELRALCVQIRRRQLDLAQRALVLAVFGLRFQDRAKRLEEGVEIMRGLMTGDFFSYEGKHFRFPDIKLNPVPEKPIPILLCGHAEPAMRRAARIGDGWIPHAISSAQAREMIATIRRYRADYGRGAEPFSAVVPLLDAFEPDGYRRAEEFGVTHILTTPWALYGGSHRSLADKRDGLRRFADDVIAKMG